MGYYNWTPIHNKNYTSPPGYMDFESDWGINFVYDPDINPSPVDNLLFHTIITPTPSATRSLKWGEPYFYDMGYLWLRFPGPVRDPYYRSPILIQDQLHYRSEFRRILPFSSGGGSRDSHAGVELNFNTAFCSRVVLRAYPPPVWVD